MSRKEKCDCGLCEPKKGQRVHPKFGYDLVKKVKCLTCSEPIGDEPYEEVRLLARFGQMLFVHKRCKLDW